MKNSNIVWTIIAIIIIVFLIYAVATRDSEPQGPEVKEAIKIGVLADLSGDYANFFRGHQRAIEFAVEDIEKEIDKKIKLIVEDQKSCDAKETVTIMNKFVSVDKVDFIIGGSCSSTTLAAAPIANQNKTIMISAISSAPSVSQAGEYVFRTYISDLLRAKKAGELAFELGFGKMATLTEITNDYSVELLEGATQAFVEKGGEVIISENITKEDLDFRTQLTKIKAESPDVLLISISSPNQIGLVAKQARELDLDIQIIHPGETPENQEVLDAGGETANGLIYIMPGNPSASVVYQALAQRHEEKYGEPHSQYFTEAYDALMLGVKAVLASDGTKEDVKNKLHEVSKTYKGVSGNTEFDINGDVTKPILVKQIKDGQFVEYQPEEPKTEE